MNKKRMMLAVLVLLGLVIASWGVFGAEKSSVFSKAILLKDSTTGDIFYYQYNYLDNLWQYKINDDCDYVNVGSVCGNFDPAEEISDPFRGIDSKLQVSASIENGLTVLCEAALNNNLEVQVEGVQADVNAININVCVDNLISLAAAETAAQSSGQEETEQKKETLASAGTTAPSPEITGTQGCLNPLECRNIDELWLTVGKALDISQARDNKIWGVTGAWVSFYDVYGAISGIPTTAPKGEATKLVKIYRDYEGYIKNAARTYDIPISLIVAVIYQESEGKSEAVSRAGAKGLMQLTAITIADINKGASKNKCGEIGIDQSNVFEAEKNIRAGTCYLSYLYDKYKKDLSLSLAAYNAGPGTVSKFCNSSTFGNCKNSLSSETQNYVPAVLKYKKLFEDNDLEKYDLITDIPGVQCWADECILNEGAKKALIKAGKNAQDKKYTLRVNSAFRTVEKQSSMWKRAHGGVCPTNPQSPLVNGKPDPGEIKEKCMHVKGIAVDVRLLDQSGNMVNMGCMGAPCGTSGQYNQNNFYQRTLRGDIMKPAGWNGISNEWWHFEYGK